MSEESSSTKSAARWLPFQCPSCFGLFRARRETVGELGRCPGCSARLLIPEPEAATSAAKEATEADSSGQEEKNFAKAEIVKTKVEEASNADWNQDQPRRKKRFLGVKSEIPDWEDGEMAKTKTTMPWAFVISMIMLGALLITGGMKFLQKPSSGNVVGESLVAQANSMLSEENARLKEMSAGAAEEEDQVRKMIDSFDRFDPAKIKAAIQQFLSATTLEEKMKASRAIEGIEERMKNYYGAEDPKDEGFRSIDHTNLVYRGNFVSTSVRLNDFLDYPLVVERLGEDDYRVDWESWVGYCEKKAGELIVLKPTKPVLVRVITTHENYYNYSFSDDEKWISLKLAFRDEDRTLWGYAERDSNIGTALRVYRQEVQSRPLILRIKYPENSRANDQVIIHELISDGWVTFPKE